jgi:hypothetical protein
MNQQQQDEIDDIGLFGALSTGHEPLDHERKVAGDHSVNYLDAEPSTADAPPIDDEQTITEVEIRERLIEWLVGFLPGGPRTDQVSL